MLRWFLLLLVAASAYGCAAGSLPVQTPTGVPTPAQTAVPLATRPLVMTPVPPLIPLASPTAGGGLVPGNSPADALVALARADLTRRLAIADAEITLVNVEAREWSDSSLGCPRPGMMYAQVITPGYLILLSAGGKQYEYHASTRNVILCDR